LPGFILKRHEIGINGTEKNNKVVEIGFVCTQNRLDFYCKVEDIFAWNYSFYLQQGIMASTVEEVYFCISA
jgi:hypothetical protein